MARTATLNDDLRRLIVALRRFADEQGWQPGDYRILVRVVAEWGRFHVLLLGRSFSGLTYSEQYAAVISSLERSLRDNPDLLESTNLVLRTFDQVEEGGLYAISPAYTDADELLGASMLGSS